MGILIVQRHSRKRKKQKMVGGAGNRDAAYQLVKDDIALLKKKGKSMSKYVYQFTRLEDRGSGRYVVMVDVVAWGGTLTILAGVDDAYG